MASTKTHTPPYRFCPGCAHPLPTEVPTRQRCPACGTVVYHHSNPCVGALIEDARGRVLLGRRGVEPYRGHWNLIGGFLEYGEDPREGLRREVLEELGAPCSVGAFVASFADTYGPEGVALLNLYYRVALHDTAISPRDDVTQLAWFPVDQLPENLAFDSDRRALRAMRRSPPGDGA